MLKTEQDVLALISSSQWHMKALRAVREIDLPDGWIGAGFVRNLVWDTLHGHHQLTPLNDVDVVYYDPAVTDEAEEKKYEMRLHMLAADIPWSVKNMARMHIKNGDPPYQSVNEGLCHWCETPTAVGARMNSQGSLELLAPLGISDLVNGICRPTPFTLQKPEKIFDYRQRITDKGWQNTWPKLKICNMEDEKKSYDKNFGPK